MQNSSSIVNCRISFFSRVLNNVSFICELFYTLLTQIESILDSRPLIPLTDDPENFFISIPGHFLIGSNLQAIPETPSKERPWLRAQHFWKRWYGNYLHTLQHYFLSLTH